MMGFAANGPHDELLRRIADASERVVETLAEIDYINLQQNPRILSDYQLKIGCWENELFEAEIAMRRAKRKYALAQAADNAGRVPDDAALETQLNEEFSTWEAQLKERLNTYFELMDMRAGMRGMAPPEEQEFKRLHRVLVKRLHPDLHPELDARGRKLFDLAQQLYERGDLEGLRSLEVASRSYEQAGSDGQSGEELVIQLEMLTAQLSLAKEQLSQLKCENPYALKELLNNPAWVTQRTSELKARIEEFEAAARLYRRRYAALVGDNRGV